MLAKIVGFIFDPLDRRFFMTVIAIIAIVIFTMAFFAFLCMLLWNALMPIIFGLPKISVP